EARTRQTSFLQGHLNAYRVQPPKRWPMAPQGMIFGRPISSFRRAGSKAGTRSWPGDNALEAGCAETGHRAFSCDVTERPRLASALARCVARMARARPGAGAGAGAGGVQPEPGPRGRPADARSGACSLGLPSLAPRARAGGATLRLESQSDRPISPGG